MVKLDLTEVGGWVMAAGIIAIMLTTMVYMAYQDTSKYDTTKLLVDAGRSTSEIVCTTSSLEDACMYATLTDQINQLSKENQQLRNEIMKLIKEK